MAVVLLEHQYTFRPDEVFYRGNVNVQGTINAATIAFSPSSSISGNLSVAFANNSSIIGDLSFVHGNNHHLLGNLSMLSGQDSSLSGEASHGFGSGLVVQADGMLAVGTYNAVGDAALVIGNGSSETARSDSLVVYRNGNVRTHHVTLNRLTLADEGSGQTRDAFLDNKAVKLQSDFIISGNLSVLGEVANVYAETQVSEQIIVDNKGTGPGLVVNQHGDQNIAEFRDDDQPVMQIFDGGSILIGNAASQPVELVEVLGNIKATAFVGTIFTGNLEGIIPADNIPFNLADGNLRVVDGFLGVGSTTPPFERVTVEGNVAPTVDATYSLGSLTYSWENLFVTNVINPSDARLKKDISPLGLGMDFINSVRPVSYGWTDGRDTKSHFGFIAQEVEQCLKAAGMETSAMCLPGDTYRLNYIELIAPLVKACQELHKRVLVLEGKAAAATQTQEAPPARRSRRRGQ
jgi:hypothetical protein